MDAKLQGYIDKLNALNFKEMYNGDFFLTWEKTDDEIEAVFTVADALRYMRENNISTKVFESGLGISLFRDNSTRTRFSFASACNLLGLEVQDLALCRHPVVAVLHFERHVKRASLNLVHRSRCGIGKPRVGGTDEHGYTEQHRKQAQYQCSFCGNTICHCFFLSFS